MPQHTIESSGAATTVIRATPAVRASCPVLPAHCAPLALVLKPDFAFLQMVLPPGRRRGRFVGHDQGAVVLGALRSLTRRAFDAGGPGRRALVQPRRSDHGHGDPRRAVERRPRRGQRGDRRGDARDASDRRADEPVQGVVGAVAHQPRRRPTAGAKSAPSCSSCRRGRSRFPNCPAAPSTSRTRVPAICTTTAGASRPSEAQLAAAREAIGYRHLMLDRPTRTVRFRARRRAHRPRRLRQGLCGRQRRRDPRAARRALMRW